MLVMMLAATGVVLVALIVGIAFAGVGSAKRPIAGVSAARRRRLARIWSSKAWHPAGVAPTKTARSSGLT